MNITTKKEARAVSAAYFFPGESCKRGHVAKRYVASGNCVICNRLRVRAWRLANPERNTEYAAAWRLANPEIRREYYAAWAKANPGKCKAIHAKRRAAKLQRTPSWADLDAINKFYVACPEGHHVDHEIPLQGELISGLHVLGNLQYLPAIKNISKGNRINLAAHN